MESFFHHLPFFFSTFGSSFLLFPASFSVDLLFFGSSFFLSDTFAACFESLPLALIGFLFSSSSESTALFLLFLFKSSSATLYFFFQAASFAGNYYISLWYSASNYVLYFGSISCQACLAFSIFSGSSLNSSSFSPLSLK